MDERSFRNAMGTFVTGVTVITTKTNKTIHGMTANAFMSISLKPKLITVSIDNNANMLNKIQEANSFSVNILSNDQKEVSMHFAGQKRNEKVVEFETIQSIPVIKNALTSIVCKLYDAYTIGDHTLFIGEVDAITSTEGSPLTFYCGKYGTNKIK